MAQTEITVQIFDKIENVIKKIESLGFSWKDTFTGKDFYYSTLEKEKISKASYKELLDTSIIVREFHKKSTDKLQTMLVHKKKVLDEKGRVVGEDKTSLSVESSKLAQKLLSSAGLENWMSLCQQNNFFVSGEVTVIIGTVEGLDGTFIEIEEYESIKNKSEKEKFEILCEFVSSLGFETGGDYSCKKIYMLYNKKNNKQ